MKLKDIEIHYKIDEAHEAPWLIFCNSLATNLSMWDRETEHLSGRFRILRFDQRGHGQSNAPAGRYSILSLLDDVISLMDRLSIERADICGLSLGGATAMGIAQRYPDRLRRLVVCSSPCASTSASAKVWEQRASLAAQSGMAALCESTLERWFSADTLNAKAPQVARVRSMILSTPVLGYIGCAAALADHDFRSEIGKVKCPVMFLVGEHDASTQEMRQMHADLPGSKMHELSAAGHICNLDQPAAFVTALDEFLG
ncbi:MULTISPECIES: 3-oxoadipate enol-lactonase [Paraburkholderia]|uniref:3-oxoadipate enol-lactonase n=1 Tax=Paraburkholderia metrosideri TaxID=580937 RepID=A0ABW9E3S7_9BURK